MFLVDPPVKVQDCAQTCVDSVPLRLSRSHRLQATPAPQGDSVEEGLAQEEMVGANVVPRGQPPRAMAVHQTAVAKAMMLQEEEEVHHRVLQQATQHQQIIERPVQPMMEAQKTRPDTGPREDDR